ncbi:hypothetical protein N7492_004698 [Penicillium capsulatum]|uniref:Major facilitator superfamily (MFS) profile domain-containing protein n=1 Tax=Penicillium capsulatum TaxID=69766 RepID=A0A9W9LR76_9EURO|nr:hypothetical protein N7492_004698 [Penicillium capsulatum]KAJ6136193.1 hypothetical protein N7512_001353 [Penicillium capsulatum]
MQSYLQHRWIKKQLERQYVVKHDEPNDVWTHERRYWYGEGRLHSEDRESGEDRGASRRREHGQRTRVSGPTLEPHHTARSHLERDGDVERADVDPEFETDPWTINTRDSLGGGADLMVTGVERDRRRRTRELDGETLDGDAVDGQNEKKQKLIVVTFEGDTDPMDPHNWSTTRRVLVTLLVSFLGAIVLWSSTIDATALTSTQKLFRTSFELQTLPTALFLICLGFGSLITAPLSEVVGRNPVYLVCLPLFMLFDMGAGLAQNVVHRIVCRALAGLFGSAPLLCSAAALVDIWSLIERVYAFPFYSIITFLGATVAPTPGSIVTWVQAVSWRWVDWMTIIFAGVLLALVVLFLPETYSPVLLYWKAEQLRRLTGDDRYRAPIEFKRVSLGNRLAHALYRPILLFWTEPIIMIFAGYLAIIFIILYTFSAGFVLIFEKDNGLDQGQAGLTFLAISVGVCLAALLVPLTMKLVRRDIRRTREQGRARPQPEFNLYMSMFGAPFISIGLFWMAWTSRPSIPIWVPLSSAVVFGFGVLCVFVSSYQYVAAAFEYHPASALASIQLLRLTAAGVMAVIAEIMYKKLGENWTLTLLGCISVLFLPVPYVLYKWGFRVRQWSRYAPSEM